MHVCHVACTKKKFPQSSGKDHEITTIAVLMTASAYNHKSLSLCVYFSCAHTSSVVVQFANIVECEQDGMITNGSQLRKCLFSSDIFLVDAIIINFLKLPHTFKRTPKFHLNSHQVPSLSLHPPDQTDKNSKASTI